MTDKQFAELLELFHQIEALMVKNGAKLNKPDGTPTSFSEKVKSFDDFQSSPPNPGDIGSKFYLDKVTGRYEIKDDFDFEYDIYYEFEKYRAFEAYKKKQKEHLEKYRAFKAYKKKHKEHKATLMHGNYNTLIKIGHERNQLLHIFFYEIDDYKQFVKVCKSMITYLNNPDVKSSLEYETYESPTLTYPSLSRNRSTTRSVSYSSKGKTFNAMSIIFWSIGTILLVGIGKILILAYAIDSYLLWGAIGYGIYAIFTEDLLPILGAGIVGWILIFTSYSSQEKEKLYNKKELIKTCHYYYISVNKLYIRDKSNISGVKIGSVRKNSKVCITKMKNGWFYIDEKGWVSSKYLSKEK